MWRPLDIWRLGEGDNGSREAVCRLGRRAGSWGVEDVESRGFIGTNVSALAEKITALDRDTPARL